MQQLYMYVCIHLQCLASQILKMGGVQMRTKYQARPRLLI